MSEVSASGVERSSGSAHEWSAPAIARSRDPRERALFGLEAARRRLHALLAHVPEAALLRQHSPLMSPIVWDLAHIANYEEQWLLRALGSPALTDPAFDRIYDAFRQPRSIRSTLPLLGVAEALGYLAAVRERALEVLEISPLEGDPLRAGGFVWGMVVQHEQQHLETILATLALMHDFPSGLRPGPRASRSSGSIAASGERFLAGGTVAIGSADPWAYDNERPRHEVQLAPFFIDTHPVTCGRFLEFIEAGGYRDQRLWTPEGWAHLDAEQLEAPLYWEQRRGRWYRRRFDALDELDPDEPVQHVCWYEADAFARWCDKRLPTELEWECAVAGAPPPAPSSANVGQQRLGPLPVGTFPEAASAAGVQGLLGDVWEWTSSEFRPWPGFVAFPYREYSEVFFGAEYRVLRGGSWATHPDALRASFRNWDYPTRRQIFSGFRLARSAPDEVSTRKEESGCAR